MPQIQSAADPDYFLSFLGGLEDIVTGELEHRAPGAEVLESEWGRAFVRYSGGPEPLTRLRSIENVFAYIGRIENLRPDSDGLKQIEEFFAAADLSNAMERWKDLHIPWPNLTFRVTGQRQGEQEYTSQDAAAAAGTGIQRQQDWDVDLTGYNLEFIVKIEDDLCLAGLRLTDEPLHRRSRVIHGLASLNPTAAYAMSVMSDPEPGQVVLDPMCGTGTILIERARVCEATLIGFDYFRKPLYAADENTKFTNTEAYLLQADARQMCLADGSIDRIICNLPWGHRVLSELSVFRLYRESIPEMARVLRPGGLAVLLTMQKGMIEDILGRTPQLQKTHRRVLAIGGLNPQLYILRRGD